MSQISPNHILNEGLSPGFLLHQEHTYLVITIMFSFVRNVTGDFTIFFFVGSSFPTSERLKTIANPLKSEIGVFPCTTFRASIIDHLKRSKAEAAQSQLFSKRRFFSYHGLEGKKGRFF